MIEDELVHWWKDEKNEQHRTVLRLETMLPEMNNGFPKDGLITLRLMNTVGTVAFRMSPEESLRIGTILLALSKELIDKKRHLWHSKD